ELARAADAAGVDTETVREWAYRDPEFISRVNQLRRERADRLRAEFSELASDAIGVIRGMVRSEDVPPSVRLKACCLILAATDALKPEPIGPTSEEGARAEIARRDLLESLGG